MGVAHRYNMQYFRLCGGRSVDPVDCLDLNCLKGPSAGGGIDGSEESVAARISLSLVVSTAISSEVRNLVIGDAEELQFATSGKGSIGAPWYDAQYPSRRLRLALLGEAQRFLWVVGGVR